MNKKVISSVLAGAMAVSTLGVVASATDNKTDTGANTLSGKASLLEAVVDADIPAELESYINPYGAQVTAQNTANVEANVKYSDGIISPTYKIVNNSTAAGLKVNATAKITGSSSIAVNTKVLDDAKLAKATDKQVFAFLNTTTDVANSKPLFAETKYVANDNQLAFTEDGAKAANIMSLGKSATDKTGYFYVGGQCTPNPETAWDSKDTVTLDLILDLVPSAGDPADLTLADITLDSTASTPVSIEKEFDGTKKVYEVAAKGSAAKAKSIKVTANFAGTATPSVKGASVYVKFNGKMVATGATASATSVGATLTAGVAGTAGNAVVTPKNDGTNDVDYAVGDKLEFIVVDDATNESTTYVINFI